MSLAVVSISTPPAGVLHSVAVALVAVSTWFTLGADEGNVMPLIFSTLGLVALPSKSPSSWISPGADEVASLAVGILPHAAALAAEAMRAWLAVGAPLT